MAEVTATANARSSNPAAPREAPNRRVSAALVVVLIVAGAFLGVFVHWPGGGQPRAAVANAPPPVVFLLFDEFPVIDLENANGELDAGRFPNFARLAQSSVWFRNTTTLSANTTVAVPAILTGNPPKRGARPTARDYPNNLFTLLGRRYRMVVLETQTQLCPKRLCKRKQHHALSENATLPRIDQQTFWRGRVHAFNRWVARLRRPDVGPPTLYFMHSLFPHTPWVFLPDGRARALAHTNTPGRIGERWYNSALAVQAWQRHLLQTGYTDRLLGQVIRRLQKTGLWDNALIVVTADHGISFRGGDLRRHPSRTNLAELAFTPLFMKLPGRQDGRLVDRHVLTVDILPTIADVLGSRIPWKTAGSSALGTGAGSPTVKVKNISAPYPVALAQRRRSRVRQLRLFGSGSWGTQFSGTGEYHALVGDRVRTLHFIGQGDGEAKLDKVGSAMLRSFPRHSPLIPSPLVGKLAGVESGTQLALALNGRIAAVTEAYRDPRGPIKFSALAGESAFTAGRNRAQLFVVSGPARRPVLRELRVKLAD
ncbi:MAG TPA: sulfatase-like hydrolase/transferase [Gaiellaceae bacterium]|nr:sulfatase-like hydrolase/transferase [Gaiellaceae bacterium]